MHPTDPSVPAARAVPVRLSLGGWLVVVVVAAVVAVVAALLVLMTGRSGPPPHPAPESQPQPQPQPQPELRYAVSYLPETLEPARAYSLADALVNRALFEGLFVETPSGLQPGLVEQFAVSDDGRHWTFTLREGLTWNDGDPLTAHDVVAGWRRALDPATLSDYSSMLDPVRGAADFRRGDGEWSAVGVQADGDRTIRVELERPTPTLPQRLALPVAAPVPRHLIQRHGDRWAEPDRIVGNGPFRVESAGWNRLVLVRADAWRRSDDVALQRVTLVAAPDDEARLRAFATDEFDIIEPPAPDRLVDFAGRPEFRVADLPGTYFYGINTDANEALGKPEVRRALALAIDVGVLADVVEPWRMQPWRRMVPPMRGYPSEPLGRYDLAEARRLLAAAGYADGEGFPELAILFNQDRTHWLIAEHIATMWREELGIPVVTESVEWKVYLDRVDRRDYAVARAGWIADVADPVSMLDVMRRDSGNNDTGWSDDGFERALDAARSLTGAERLRQLADAEERLVEGGAIIPLFRYRRVLLARPRVQGLAFDRLGQFRLSTLRIVPSDD